MPECPEVTISKDIIKPLLIGKKIINVFTGKNSRYKQNPPEGFNEFLKTVGQDNCRILNVENKGKFMYWTFANEWYLLNTFGMTGQWSPIEGKHPCLGLYLGEDSRGSCETMYFNDPRHFGTIKFTNKKSDLTDKLNELGWDPLNREFDLIRQNYIINQIKNKKKCISEVLMNQSIFAGVGNYIKSESLYESNISPWRICNSLSNDDIIRLCNCIIKVMKDSYAHQGATLSTYKTPYGEEGRYSSLFKVYGKNIDSFGNKIIRETTPDKRTTHWVPNIQK